MCSERKTLTMRWPRRPNSELWSRLKQPHSAYILPEPKVSRIGASVAEHFCPFLMAATAKMPFKQRCSRNTSGIMWSAGSTGQGAKECQSSAWKTSLSSTDVHWLLRGLRPRSMTMATHKFLWRTAHPVTEGQISVGTIYVELWNITTVKSTQSVLPWLRLLAVH